MSAHTLPPAMRAAGRISTWALGGVLILLTLAAVWVGVRGAIAYGHLERIQTDGSAAATEVASDPSSAAPTLARLASDAEAAHGLTSDPVWKLAERTPWIGPQLAAFGTVAAASDELLRGSLLPLATAAQSTSLDSLKPVDGRIDTSGLATLVAPSEAAAASARDAAAAVESIDPTPLIGVVGRAVGHAEELFARSSNALDALSRTTKLLPAMLGKDGPRDYLLLVQNNAEWRSLGGITGTAILLRTDAGAISLVDTRSATSLSQGISAPLVQLPEDIQAIYQTRPARYFHNLTQIPDFTVDGPLARDMYKAQTSTDVAGVIVVDPVVLSYLLHAVGPVTVADGQQLSADNAVPLLLNQVYERYSAPTAQDAFFASATGAVFQALLQGRGSTAGMLAALARATEEHRVLIWSANPEEQSVVAGTTLAGELPATNEHTARFGVYLNDGTGSKMSYYVKPEVSLNWDQCQQEGGTSPRQLTLTLALSNSAPLDAQTSLPPYITGNGVYGVAPGSATIVSNLYLPQGYELVSASASNGTAHEEATLDGRQVLTFGMNLDPQTSASVTVVVAATTSASEAEAIVTPTADASLNPTVVASCNNASVADLQ